MNKKPEHNVLSCPSCKLALGDYAIQCSGCGLDLLRNDLRSPEVIARSINRLDQSVFFYVSPLKLVVMSIFTFGFYELFWFYKNWCYVQEHTNRKVMPLLRAIMSVFFYYSLLKEMSRAGAAQKSEFQQSLLLLVFGYIGLCLCSRLPAWLGIIGFLSPLALVPTQNYINTLNTESPTPINSRFTPVNWVGIVLGAGLLVFDVAAIVIK